MRQVGLWVAVALAFSGCDPFNTSFDDIETAYYYRASSYTEPPTANPTELSVMTWNIKFGAARADLFFDCTGDEVLISDSVTRANLDGLVNKINFSQPDVLLLQEVDVQSKRSAYIDEVQYLLDRTDLNYGVYASAWMADYVPSDGIGRINMGNAILSRWPLDEAVRISLPPIEDQDALTQYFYLKRNILRARIDADFDNELWIANVHTAAFAGGDTKRQHVDRFTHELDQLTADGRLFVAGGDLNLIPRGSVQTQDFPDSACPDEGRFAGDNYSEQLGLLDGLYAAYTPAIALTDFQADNDPYYSFTADGTGFWNRKLDYLFTNGEFVAGSGLVHQDPSSGGVATLPLSDHAPVSVTIDLQVGP